MSTAMTNQPGNPNSQPSQPRPAGFGAPPGQTPTGQGPAVSQGWGGPPSGRAPEPAKEPIKEATGPMGMGAVVVLALSMTVLAIGLVYYLSTTRWLGVMWPLGLLVGSSALVGLITSLIATASTPEMNLKEMAKPFGVGLILCAGLGVPSGLAWTQDGVRKAVLDQAATRDMWGVLEQAIEDPNVSIASHACGVMMRGKSYKSRRAAMDVLERRSEIAGTCLVSESSAQQENLTGQGDKLVNRWYRRMSQVQEDAACAQAVRIGDLGKTSAQASAALLSCTLTFENEKVRTCCAQAMKDQGLTGETLAQNLAKSTDETYSLEYTTPLVSSSWHQLDITASEKKRAAMASLVSKPMRKYSMTNACSMLLEGTQVQPIVKQLFATGESACGVKQRDLAKDPVFWEEMCQELLELEDVNAFKETMCTRLDEQLVTRAISAASSMIKIATVIRQNPKVFASINRAAMLRRMSLSGQYLDAMERQNADRGVYDERGWYTNNSSFMYQAIHIQRKIQNQKAQKIDTKMARENLDRIWAANQDVIGFSDDMKRDEKTKKKFLKMMKAYDRFNKRTNRLRRKSRRELERDYNKK